MGIENIGGIYRIICIHTGKFYIGSSKNVIKRFKSHKTSLRTGKHHSSKLQRAWIKYGEEAFKFELLEEVVDEKRLRDVEQLYINKYLPHKKGFNIAATAYGPVNVARKCGDQSARSKMTEEMVKQAAIMFNEGMSLRKIGSVFKVDGSTIGRALRSSYWKKCVKDKIQTHRYYKGENTSRAKMKAQDVIDLYQKYTSGIPVLELKKEYNITTSSIRCILLGRSWKCLGLVPKEQTSRTTKQHVQEMYNIYKSNIYTKKEIGFFYNLHERSVSRLLKPLLEKQSPNLQM